uniref:fimbrillin family protein n=1 Tax=Prevotella sp. TaxID=59823 RepID=UPI004024E250
MKIMRRLMGCAAAILALTACSESEDLLAAYHSDSKAVHITAQVGKASADGFTRSNPLGDAEKQAKFNENDEISVQADGQDAVTYKLKGSEWQPQGGKFLKWEKETMNFTAYYPASFNGTINQPTEYTSPESLAAADFMSFSGPKTNTNDNKRNQLTLTMERKMARVVVEIAGFNDQYAGATVNSINSLSICGIKAYKHSDNKFYALIKPCDAQNSETFLSLDVAEGESKTTEKLTGIPKLEAGKSYTYKLTVGKNKISVLGITVADWDNTGIITEGSKAEHIIPYVTFKANGKQTFQMTAVPDYEISGLEYSVNNDEKWRKVEKDRVISFGGEYGDLRLRGTNHNGTAKDETNYSTINFTDETVNVACTGDIRTLLDWKNYNIVKTDNARFCSLFETCSVLTSAPELPATKLADCCYYYMFWRCTNLTSAPVLPATTLAQECYSNMFADCTNLTSAPELPATKLAVHCYYSMFSNCPKLSSVTMLAPKSEIETKNDCVLNWLYNAEPDASVTSRTLKVQDEAAYNALVDKGYLPDIWQKGATGTTVVDENNAEINIE